MKLKVPERGSVIRYSYLWADEHRRGSEEGRKDRPAMVLAISVRKSDHQTEIVVLAITHRPPASPTDAVALPAAVKRRLKLDDDASWIATTAANAFVWPGPDIRPIPNRKPLAVVYGKVPDDLLREVARSFLANRERQRSHVVPRTS